MPIRFITLLSLTLAVSPLAAQDWAQFRGSRSATSADKNLPLHWDSKKGVLWNTDIPGRGWSSPIVVGDKVFVTSVLNDKTPPPRPGLYIQDLYGKIPPGEHVWQLVCLDLESGRPHWSKTLHEGTPKGPIHLKNTYASETAASDGKHVYIHLGNVGLFCYDLEGKQVWAKTLPAHKTRMGWGTGASPIVHQGKLILVNDNEDASYLAAFDAKSGDELWKVSRDEASNWSTPFIWENDRRTEIVTCGTKKVRSYDLDGKLLWELAGMSSIVIPTPSAHGGLLYIASGYILDSRRPLYAIRSGASGDISLKDKETANDFIVWSQKHAGPYHPSPVVYDGLVYVLLDKGFMTCYDARTGKEVYARERIDAASDKFTASPIAADGKIYCLSEDGDTYVIRAGRKFEVLAKNPLTEMCLATPALTRGTIILRTAGKIYRLGHSSNPPK